MLHNEIVDFNVAINVFLAPLKFKCDKFLFFFTSSMIGGDKCQCAKNEKNQLFNITKLQGCFLYKNNLFASSLAVGLSTDRQLKRDNTRCVDSWAVPQH